MEWEPRSLEAFVSERGRRLLRAAWLLTGDAGHAEDLLQTALAKCWDRFEDLGDDAIFEAYLRTTLHRTYVSWWRRRSWTSERPTGQDLDAVVAEPATEARLDLHRALMELTRPQRSAIVLHHLEDLPIAEVARILRLPANTVKTHIHRGVAKLRRSPHLSQEVS